MTFEGRTVGLVSTEAADASRWDREHRPSFDALGWESVGVDHDRLHLRVAFDPTVHPSVSVATLDDGSICVLDGELYSGAGARLGADSLLRSFRGRGVAAIEEIDGIACLLLFDAGRGDVVIARDPLGLGSAFVSVRGEALLWSSSLTALRRVTGHRSIDLSALDYYVSSGFVPAPWTLIDGIEKLGAGELLRWKSGSATRVVYYDMPVDLIEADLPTRLETLRGSLEQSVRDRLDDPDRTGVLLSGGVDSMLLLALATKVADQPIRSVTFRYADYEGPLNEGERAAACARAVGSPHEEITVEPARIPERLGQVLDNFGEPFSLGIHTAMIGQLEGSGIRDLLSGSASDSPYAEGQIINAHRFAGLPRPLRATIRAGTRALKRADDMWLRRTAGAHLPVVGGLASALHGGIWTARTSLPYHAGDWALRRPLRADLYQDPTVLDRALARRHEIHERATARVADLPLLSATRVIDCLTFDAEIMYSWNLNSSRPHDLVIRTPYSARAVLEPRMRFTPTVEGKPDVRALAAELLPHEMAYAPKVYQAVPLSSWLRGPLRPFLDDTLATDRLDALGTFDPGTVRRLVDAHQQGRADNAWGLWTLALATLWQERLEGDRALRGVA